MKELDIYYVNILLDKKLNSKEKYLDIWGRCYINKFAIRLRELREEKGIKGKKLAEDLYINAATVTNWEKGNRSPGMDMLIKICDYFECSSDYILGRTDNKNKYNENKYTENKYNKNIEKYPYSLSSEEVEKMLKNLDSIGLNIDKLIKSSKSK